ncbi:hypothetical protein ACO0LM_23220 [Undibacterium sp. Di26W]|uniref:hypothetical protein n=1 Tax=Undibacterium sp. Di26W TaxID=3413035 RepID=UPI003BF44C25
MNTSLGANNFISIGAQMGGPEPCLVGELKVPLYHAFAKHVTSTHCAAIDEYAIILRVDGSLDKFGAEGITRLRFEKARRYIKVEIQIPEAVWQPMTKSQTKEYLADQVQSAIAICVQRLNKERSVVAEERLREQVEAAIGEYLAA